MSDRAVVDAIRQTLRCESCRAEEFLPKAPSPLTTFSAALLDFAQQHEDCSPLELPAPCRVRTGADGAAFVRDHAGLWWSWLPQGKNAFGRPNYQTQPLTPGEIRRGLAELIARMEDAVHDAQRPMMEEKVSLYQARAAQESEGWA